MQHGLQGRRRQLQHARRLALGRQQAAQASQAIAPELFRAQEWLQEPKAKLSHVHLATVERSFLLSLLLLRSI